MINFWTTLILKSCPIFDKLTFINRMFFSSEYNVYSLPKSLLLKTHHLWNSTTELILQGFKYTQYTTGREYIASTASWFTEILIPRIKETIKCFISHRNVWRFGCHWFSLFQLKRYTAVYCIVCSVSACHQMYPIVIDKKRHNRDQKSQMAFHLYLIFEKSSWKIKIDELDF